MAIEIVGLVVGIVVVGVIGVTALWMVWKIQQSALASIERTMTAERDSTTKAWGLALYGNPEAIKPQGTQGKEFAAQQSLMNQEQFNPNYQWESPTVPDPTLDTMARELLEAQEPGLMSTIERMRQYDQTLTADLASEDPMVREYLKQNPNPFAHLNTTEIDQDL